MESEDLTIRGSLSESSLPERLCEVLERHRGDIPVRVRLDCSDALGLRADLMPNRYLFVEPSGGLVRELEDLVGPGRVRLRT